MGDSAGDLEVKKRIRIEEIKKAPSAQCRRCFSTYVIKLVFVFSDVDNFSTERSEIESTNLAKLLTNRDKDDGDVANKSNDGIQEPENKTERNHPDRIQNFVRTIVVSYVLTAVCKVNGNHFEASDTERNTDKGTAQNDTENDRNDACPKTIEENPKEFKSSYKKVFHK